MQCTRSAIVTGCNGSIGSAICRRLRDEGIFVLGIDIHKECLNQLCTDYLSMDLERLVCDIDYAEASGISLKRKISDSQLIALINNAAVQIVGDIQKLELKDFRKTLDVNLVAPWYLTKLLHNNLSAGKGWIINIGSIHATLTKPNFVAYATSKGGLASLTRALAVDIGSSVKCCLIEPAAIQTEMLVSGLNGDLKKLSDLASFHPSNTIGSAEDIAGVVGFVLNSESAFLNGISIPVTGGIMYRLHDPE